MLLAGTSALLAVPRAVPVVDIPEPAVRAEVIAASLRADEIRARDVAAKAARGELDHDVRALGDAVRAFGKAEISGDEAAIERAHRRLVEATQAAIARSPDAVLGLRAYQARAFVREMRAFEETGRAAQELEELAGNFARRASAVGWYDEDDRRLLASDGVLTALYKKRWNEITGLAGEAFAPSLDEQRAVLGFLIAHPGIPAAQVAGSAGPEAARAAELQREVSANLKRIEKIRELARIDPSFPGAIAEGVVLFRLGRFEAAAIAFERHLAVNPDGPWTLRARNYLKASLEAR